VSIIRDDIEIERDAPPLAPLEARIGFPDGGSELSQAARAELMAVIESPQVAAGGPITLRGHSDSEGTDVANLRASQQRAEAVRDWLVGHGIDKGRIRVIALGEQNPVEPNALPDGRVNERGRAANRRVDLSIAVPEGTPAAQPTGAPETLVDELSG
jgi:OOP family OmpA-OmpF porin